MVECWTEVDRWAQEYRSVRLDAGSMDRLYDMQNWRKRLIPARYVRRVDRATPSSCKVMSFSVKILSTAQG